MASLTVVNKSGEEDSPASNPVNTPGKTCQLVVYNKAGEVIGAGIAADSFMDFNRRFGRNTAVLVELATCGEEIFVSTCKLFKRLPRGATYRARLLQRTSAIPAQLTQGASGCHVWVEA